LSLSFGKQSVGVTSVAQTATLANSGNTSLSLSGIKLTGAAAGDFAETNTCGNTLTAGATCTITVTFTPATAGMRTAIVSFTDDAQNSPQVVYLSGVGVTAP
jgi:hypothetical protein